MRRLKTLYIFFYAFIAASWAVLLPALTVICKIDIRNAIALIALADLLLFAFVRGKRIIEDSMKAWHVNLKQKEEARKSYAAEVEEAEAAESEIKTKELMIANLYEITKKMSESLTFDDIFDVLSVFLKGNFDFRKCELAIFKQQVGGLVVDRKYGVLMEEKGIKSAEDTLDYAALAWFLSQHPGGAYLDREQDADEMKALRVEEGASTFAIAPLLSEKKLVGALIIDNLPRQDFDKFVILAIQFALEIKKVLLYETVEELAITDGLTGLYVRRYFLERLKEEMNRSKRYSFPFAFLMLDIDDFKKCNDTYGHLVGDVVLRDIGQIMRSCVREIDLIARYGGEEFSILLPETDREGARMVADRIRKRVEENVFKAYDETLKITISIGVSMYPDDAHDPRQMIEKADVALYAAKRSGKNVVQEWGK